MRYIHIFPLLLVALLSVSLSACGSEEHGDGHEHAEKSEVWTCPMHPSVISDRPGACPVCHMDLVKRAASADLSEEEESMLRSVSLSPSQRVLANVATIPLLRRNLQRTITAVGVVDFAEPLQAVVSARFRGRVEKLYVNYTGAQVRKGQLLFDLYSPELIAVQQDYLIAYAALKKAEEAEQQSAVKLQQTMLEAIRGRLLMHYGLSEAHITQLERDGKALQTVSFPSPISGTVILKNIQEGRYVDDGTTLYEIADVSKVWVYFEIPEQDIRAIRIGQTVQFRSAAYPGEYFRGRVTFLDPLINNQTRSMRVRIETGNPAAKLKPGMYVDGSIELRIGEVPVVPASAVVRTGNRDVVWVEVGKNRFEARTLKLGARAGDYYEVLSGVDEGSMIVASGGYLLDSESLLLHPDHPQDAAGYSDAAVAEIADEQGRGSGNKAKEVRITVDFGYSPEIVRVKAGETLRLLFERVEDSRCTDEVVFPDFNVRKKLPAFKTTVVEITPKKKGSFTYSCGMNMLHGTLVVE